MKGEDMRNPDRIEPCCERLAQIWKKVPDWRLGQLLLNLFSEMEDADIFFMEDDKLLNRLDAILTKWRE